VAHQPFAIVPAAGGGTERRELGDEGAAQKLDEGQLRALARIGDDLERRLGHPQDVEFAIEGGEIYVLQARPVTVR
jgi:phosphoenolpyruvate synthase/pyruvate phosphate dikinase